MTSSLQPTHKSLQKLSCYSLVFKCELTELAHRIKKVIVKAFCTLAQIIVYSGQWILNCGRVTNDLKLTDPAAILKLQSYKDLPDASPKFEQNALQLANVWLTPDEMEEIVSFMDPGLFSQIVVRAAMLSGRAPLYFQEGEVDTPDSVTEFRTACHRLSVRFNTIPSSDKMAILDHLDSEILTFEEGDETKYQLISPLSKQNRSFIPQPAIISEQAKTLWTDYKALAHEGIGLNHPIMQGLNNINPA